MNYRIDKSDLFINNKLYSEGTEIELSEDQTNGIKSFLIPLNNNSIPPEANPEVVLGSVEGQKKLNTKGNKK